MRFDELALTYYCEPGKAPFQSVTRLPEAEAYRKAADLAADSRLRKNRFCAADFPGYYALRMQTERWLYEAFLGKGGAPTERHPIYFVLGESDFLYDWFGRGEAYSFPAFAAPEADISFTIGDSMTVVRSPERRLYTRSEMRALLEPCERPEELLRATPYKSSYIEAQVWRDGAWEGK